jgi:hypothetical protein
LVPSSRSPPTPMKTTRCASRTTATTDWRAPSGRPTTNGGQRWPDDRSRDRRDQTLYARPQFATSMIKASGVGVNYGRESLASFQRFQSIYL